MKQKKKKQKLKSQIITECTKCGKPAFSYGLCVQHSAEFEREMDDLPNHNDWRKT